LSLFRVGLVIKLGFQKQSLEKLRRLIGKPYCDFLGFTLDLETGILSDKLNSPSIRDTNGRRIQIFTALLDHYALTNPTPLTGTLVKFKDISGGYAYDGAFVQRAIEPIAEVFGEKPDELNKAAKLLGGIQLSLGDASVEIVALKGIPLTYILWKAEEFGASATVLYDQSASNYLPTEDLAGLGELTTARLIDAQRIMNVE
jgi:hypothetical protein